MRIPFTTFPRPIQDAAFLLQLVFVFIAFLIKFPFINKYEGYMDLEEKLAPVRQQNTAIKLDRVFKIRNRLAQREGFYALHDFGAWSICRAMVKRATIARTEEACVRIRFVLSNRQQRAVVRSFVCWRLVVEAMSAVARERSDGIEDAEQAERKDEGRLESDSNGVEVAGG